jgi:hypothetical protein
VGAPPPQAARVAAAVRAATPVSKRFIAFMMLLGENVSCVDPVGADFIVG